MIRTAYRHAGIKDFSRTTFVECHGTGTPTGDPIEANAVARVFGGTQRGVYIGSVKPNLGHSEGASGLTSIIKVVMALENRVIPPNIKFSSPNPGIPFEERNLRVPLEPTPWPEDGGERVSVNCFGIGGANAHAIVESARCYDAYTARQKESSEDDQQHLLLYSANSSESLRKMVEAYQDFMERNPKELSRLAFTLANGREHLSYRAFAIASKDGRVAPSTIVRATPQPCQVIMVFTGQGAQWPTMGKELLTQPNSNFQSSIRGLDQIAKGTLNAKWSIEEELLKLGKKSRIELAEFSQPLCTAVQIAIVDTLTAVGIKPAAVVGHSSSEIAAAYAAGALTAREAITAAWLRGTAANLQQRTGSMGAIGMGWNDVKPYLSGTSANVACENSPNSITISGDTLDVKHVIAKIKEARQDVLARLLKVNKAYHSYHMKEIGEEYHALLTSHDVVGGTPVNCTFYSSVTGHVLGPGETLSPSYWQKNLEQPVLFATAVSAILQDPEINKQNRHVFLEIGPHSALVGPIRQVMAKTSVVLPYVSTMVRNQNCVESYLTAVGRLHQLNVTVDLHKLIPRVANMPFLGDLPRYAWDYEESYWYESRLSKEWRHRKHPYHELLGIRVTESTDIAPAWRNFLHLEHVPWIRDHMILEDIVFPFAGYIAIAAEAVRQTTGIEDGYNLRHVIVGAALVITEGKPLEFLTTFRSVRLTDTLDSHWCDFSICSHNGSVWTEHCTGQVRPLEGSSLGIRQHEGRLPRALGTTKVYNMMQQAGLNYGPNFQMLRDIRAGTMEQAATAKVAAPAMEGFSTHYCVHPVIVDACLQILSVAATKGYTKKHGMVVPTFIDEIKVSRTSSDVKISSKANFNGLESIVGSAQCFVDGKAVLQMKGARLTPLPGEGEEGTKDTHPTARYEWGPHIDFMDDSTLIKAHIIPGRESYMSDLTEMTQLALVYANRRLNNLSSALPHMIRYSSWIQNQQVTADPKVLRMEDSNLFDTIKKKLDQLHGTPAAGTALALFKILCSITSVFMGRENALSVLMADDSLTQVETFRDRVFDVSSLIQQATHSRPNARILELGAGSGADTTRILESLSSEDKTKVMYSRYTFSDPSSGMVTAAKEKFQGVPNIQFSTLDIGRDFSDQDFETEEAYDLIIATNVLHTTPNSQRSPALRRTVSQSLLVM